jgi:hypothetical protein
MGSLLSIVKRLGCEDEHSAPHKAEFKNAWSYNSTHPYLLKTWCLTKPRDNFDFYLTERTELSPVLRNLKNHYSFYRSLILSLLAPIHTLIPYKTHFNIINLRSVLRTLSVAQMYKASTGSMIHQHHWQNITFQSCPSLEEIGWLINNKWKGSDRKRSWPN